MITVLCWGSVTYVRRHNENMALQVLFLSGNKKKAQQFLSFMWHVAIKCNWTGSIKVSERCFSLCLLCSIDLYVVMVKINTRLLIHHSPLVHTLCGQANWPHLTIILSCVMSNTRGARQRVLAGCLKNDPWRSWSAAHWKQPLPLTSSAYLVH